jgi:hypothetical protein
MGWNTDLYLQNARERSPDNSLTLPPFFRPVVPSADASAVMCRGYLHKRGLDDVQIELYSVGHCMSGPFAGRIIFPCLDDDELVDYVGRAWSVKGPPYKRPPSQHQAVIWNIDISRQARSVVATEGIFDAIACGPNAVSLLGKTVSPAQAAKLSRFDEVVLMLDADVSMSEARRVAERIARWVVSVKVASIVRTYSSLCNRSGCKPDSSILTHGDPASIPNWLRLAAVKDAVPLV